LNAETVAFSDHKSDESKLFFFKKKRPSPRFSSRYQLLADNKCCFDLAATLQSHKIKLANLDFFRLPRTKTVFYSDTSKSGKRDQVSLGEGSDSDRSAQNREKTDFANFFFIRAKFAIDPLK
jgi:hypothetical protein